MFKHLFALSFAVAAAASSAAQEPMPTISKRAPIYSAEGTKIGRVESVTTSQSGTPSAVRVIYNGRFITIPAASLSSGERGLTTRLTLKDLKRM